VTHLTPDERLALIEAEEAPRHPHLAACARCRAGIDAARAALAEARSVEVPEPSPLFWDHLSARISTAAAAEPEAPRSRRVWWRMLVPSAVALGAVVLAVWLGPSATKTRTVPAPGTVAARPEPPAPPADIEAAASGDDEAWAMLVQMAGKFDSETLGDALGTSEATGADLAMSDLSERERASLADLLRAEMGPGPAAQ
jgi:hypothetical protein